MSRRRLGNTATASPPAGLLGRDASRALMWSFLNTAAGRLGTVGVGIFLARLLGPGAFGTYAVATVALAAVLSFNELGVSLAIIRWPTDPKVIAPTVNTMAVATSSVLAISGFFLAPSFAASMGDPSATGVIRLMLISVILDGLASTPAALLQREFKGGRRAAIDQVNVWLGAGVSVVMALTGFGAYSLAVGRICGSLISATFLILSSPLPYRFGFDRPRSTQLLKFGVPLAGSSLLVFAINFSDQLIVGTVLGHTALGYYYLAVNLASWPVNMFSQPLRNVAPAAFSRLQHDKAAMMSAFTNTVSLLASVTVPVCLLLASASTAVVAFVYGPQWAPTAHVLTFLAVLALFKIFFELSYDFLVVRARSTAILTIQFVWLTVLIPVLIFFGHHDGLPGVAAAAVVVAAVVVTPMYIWHLRGEGLVLPLLGSKLRLPLAVGLLVAAAAWIAVSAIPAALVACLVAGLTTMAAVAALLYANRRDLAELRNSGQV